MTEPVSKRRRGGSGPERPVYPLDAEMLQRIALNYVARYATTSGRLRDYLRRKLTERGWDGEGDPENRIETLTHQFIERGYLDDARYAETRAEALARRGYGPARVRAALKMAGLSGDGLEQALRPDPQAGASEEAQWRALCIFARRKGWDAGCGLGLDPRARARIFGAFARAGHCGALVMRFMKGDAPMEARNEPDGAWQDYE